MPGYNAVIQYGAIIKNKKSMNKDAHAYHISSIYPLLEVLLHDLATCDTSLTRVE